MGISGSGSDVTLEDIQDVFSQVNEPCVPLTTDEVATKLDCPTETALRNLQKLVELETVRTKQLDASTRIWWQPNDAEPSGQQPKSAEYSAFVSAVKDYAIFMLDPEGTVVSWNDGAERIKGYAEDDIVGEHFSTFYTSTDIDAGVPQENLATAAAEGRVEDEGWRVRADGSRFWANVVITAVRDDDGELQGFTKVTRDMTERREYEQQLRRERDQTEQLIRTAPIAIAVQNADGETVLANQRAQEALGLTEREILEEPADADRWTVYDAHGDPVPPEHTPSARVLATGEPVLNEVLKVDPPSGDRMVFHINAAPIFDSDGTIERVITACEDITELKKRERQLEQRKTELETELGEILNRISDAFYALDDDFRFTHLNERAADLMERTPDELLGQDVWEVFPDAREGVYWKNLHEALETQESVSFEVYEEGLDSWFEFKVYPSESGLSIYFRDVTDRIQREQELQRADRRFEAIFEDPNILVGLLDLDGTVLDINQTAMEYIDADLADVTGEPFWETPWWGAGDGVQPEVKDWVERASAGEYVDFEADLTRPDGEQYTINGVFRPVTNDEGDVVSIIVSDRDVTERREYERKLEASNERLEQFAYAVSHDLQEPLRMVTSYMQLLDRRYSDELDEEAGEFIDFAVDGAERMREMIDALLEYSRVETAGDPFEATDLDAVLSDVRDDLQLQIEESNAEIRAESLPTVTGDPDQLRQVFQNLVDNAIEYSGDEPPQIAVSTERNGSMWEVSVRDEGIGIDPDETDRIFEIFQRLQSQEDRSGTGIGLALCQRIIERHGGEIRVESNPGEGSTFSFTLPQTGEADE